MMPALAHFTPDLEAAARHLALLDEEADSFTFQTFDDDKARKKAGMEAAAARGEKYRDPLARVLTGTLEECGPALVKLNVAGAGVFVTVNETDGKGRRLENILRIRALWQEDDGEGKPLPLAPHFEIESSPGKRHRYLLVEGLGAADFRIAQESMVANFGSDPNAKDPARVLRLAGFYHLKDPTHPHQVRIVAEEGGLPYSREGIMRAFPPVIAVPKAPQTAPATSSAQTVDGRTVADLRSALLHLRADEYADWVRMGLALSELGDVGRGLWLDWSATSAKFDAAGAAAKWDTFRSSEIGYRAVFEAAQAAGWVNPAKRQAPPTPPADVVDIQDENTRRLEFERRIQATDDFDQLVYVIYPEVTAAGLRSPTLQRLEKAISKKSGVSVGALRAGITSTPPPNKPPDNDGPDWLAELNARHAIVSLNGAVKIMNIEVDPVFSRQLVTFSPRADLILRYENRTTFRNGESVDIGTAWLRDPGRREYRGIAFAPDQDLGDEYFNLWQGWGCAAEHKGSCRLFLEFVRNVICGADETAYHYVWGWMAHMIQQPAELPGTSLVLKGLQGTGKNTFAETLGHIVNAAHFVQLSNMEHLTGKFSAHRAGALLILANEASWGGDRHSEGALKALITEQDAMMEAKHRDAVKVKNYARLIVATNREWPVPRDEDDRRFVVLEVSDARKEDAPYFAAIKAELAAGGYETLHWHLRRADISDWHPRQIPRQLRERGWDMKIRSGGSVIEWWYECLESGAVAASASDYGEDRWRTQIPTKEVQEAYSAWCMRRRKGHVENIRDLGTRLAKWGVRRIRPGSGSDRPWVYAIPKLELARALFADAITMPADYWTNDDP